MSNHTLRSPEQTPMPGHQLRDRLAGILAQQQIVRKEVVVPGTPDPDDIIGDFFPVTPAVRDNTTTEF